MIISFDYDDTITADIRTFETVMLTMHNAGWDVYVCSGRLHKAGGALAYLRDLPFIDGVFTTDYQNKRQFMEEKGIEVDVWVDDKPESILCDLDKESFELSLPNLKIPELLIVPSTK